MIAVIHLRVRRVIVCLLIQMRPALGRLGFAAGEGIGLRCVNLATDATRWDSRAVVESRPTIRRRVRWAYSGHSTAVPGCFGVFESRPAVCQYGRRLFKRLHALTPADHAPRPSGRERIVQGWPRPARSRGPDCGCRMPATTRRPRRRLSTRHRCRHDGGAVARTNRARSSAASAAVRRAHQPTAGPPPLHRAGPARSERRRGTHPLKVGSMSTRPVWARRNASRASVSASASFRARPGPERGNQYAAASARTEP